MRRSLVLLVLLATAFAVAVTRPSAVVHRKARAVGRIPVPIPEELDHVRLGGGSWATREALNVPLLLPNPTGTDGADVPAAPPAANPRNEPSVAVSPRDPNLVITSSNDYNGTGVNAGAYVSTDGGRTFTDAGFMYRAPGTDTAGDPALAYDSQGRAYFSYLDTNRFFQNGGSAKGGMFVERSDDGGITWPATATRFASNSNTATTGCVFQDKEYITVDRTPETRPDGTIAPRDWVYASWTEYHLGGTSCDAYSGSPVLVTRSVDGAQTFSTPVLASAAMSDKTQGSIPRVAPDGTLYVAYDSLRPNSGQICPTYAVTTGGVTSGQSDADDMVVAKSSDGGQTFTRTTAFAGACDAPYPTFSGATYRQNSIPSFDIDPLNGTLVLAWPNQDVYRQGIHVRTSTDGSTTWSDGATLGAPGSVFQFPWITFGPDGTLYMVYLNQTIGGLFQPELVVSHDDGKTWSTPTVLSSARSVGDDPAFEGQFDGDYLGIAVGSDLVAHPVWTDIRQPYPQGAQNVWTRRFTP